MNTAEEQRWRRLNEAVESCRLCPRLVEHRERVACTKRRAYADQQYWGRPVPGFGDRRARFLIVGLAPGAHGSNRTGRMFTGDRSGEWLYEALHRVGFASQPQAVSRDDGLELVDCYITAAARCAPPANKLTPVERDNCRPFLEQEIDLLGGIRVVLALGQVAYDHVVRVYRARDHCVPLPKPKFAHGLEFEIRPPAGSSILLLASYHPSQQNTFTGKLTQAMLVDVLSRALRQLTGTV